MNAAEPWRAWLAKSVAPFWIAHGVRADGRCVDAFDARGRPQAAPTRMRVQGRALFALSVLETMGARGAREGADCVFARLRADGWRADGLKPALGGDPDAPCALYDHACVSLGLAWRWRARADKAALEERARLRAALARVAQAGGGWRDAWPEGDAGHAQHAHMHMFEAALAWRDADPADAVARKELRALFRLFAARIFDPAHGGARERFAAGWRDGEGEDAGHLWEWASLLRLWGEAEARPYIARLVARADALGSRALGPRAWPWMERARALRLVHPARARAAWRAFRRARVAGATPGLWRDGGPCASVSTSGLYHAVSCFAREANAGR